MCDDETTPAGIEVAANPDTGKVDVLITELEESVDDDGDTYTVIVADMSVAPEVAREWALRLTIASMEAEEGALPDDVQNITDLELPE